MTDDERRAARFDAVRLLALALTALAACSGAAATPTTLPAMATGPMTIPAWLPGVWTREYIDRRGARSDLFAIHYLQTPTLFADVRIPRDRPVFSHASGFADLSDAELHSLAKQRGFAGFTTGSGPLATWHHEMDFQPPDSGPDIGRLERVDDSHMLEHALDSSYIESWRSSAPGERRFLAIRVGHRGRLSRLLLVAGNQFLFARNRAKELPAAESLDALIAESHATRAQVIEYLDCELSYGIVRDDSATWQIRQSTLPWREGHRLDFVDAIDATADDGTIRPRAPSGDDWTIPVNTFSRNDLRTLVATFHDAAGNR